MRLRYMDPRWVMMVGALLVLAIWLGCAFYFGIPYWLAFIIAPITILAEWPTFSWIDDNALMMLVPLAAVLLAL